MRAPTITAGRRGSDCLKITGKATRHYVRVRARRHAIIRVFGATTHAERSVNIGPFYARKLICLFGFNTFPISIAIIGSPENRRFLLPNTITSTARFPACRVHRRKSCLRSLAPDSRRRSKKRAIIIKGILRQKQRNEMSKTITAHLMAPMKCVCVCVWRVWINEPILRRISFASQKYEYRLCVCHLSHSFLSVRSIR